MSEKNRGVVTLQFSDGSVINSWEGFTLRDTYTDPLGSFSFTFRPPRSQISDFTSRIQKGSLVSIKINGAPQAAMLIQTVKRTISKAIGVQFDFECKSVLVTPHQGDVDPEISQSFTSDTPVAIVVLIALEPYGFDIIFPDTSANVAALTGRSIDRRQPDVVVQAIKHRDAQAQDGETAYSFCSRIFSRLGLALRVNFEGSLLIGSPDYQQDAAYTVAEGSELRSDTDAAFGTITITDTNDNSFSEVVVRGAAQDRKGQRSASRPIHRMSVEGLARPIGAPFTDVQTSTVPAGRHTYRSDSGAVFKPKYKLDKFSRDRKFCKTLCHRIHGRNSEAAYVIECEVDGLISSTGRIWTVDTVARVVIDHADIDEDMWVLETTKKMSRNGQSTALKLIPLNSLILDA